MYTMTRHSDIVPDSQKMMRENLFFIKEYLAAK